MRRRPTCSRPCRLRAPSNCRYGRASCGSAALQGQFLLDVAVIAVAANTVVDLRCPLQLKMFFALLTTMAYGMLPLHASDGLRYSYARYPPG